MVTVKKEGSAFDSKLISKEEFKKEDVTLRNNNLTVKELKIGGAYTINDILYATNSATLTDKSKFILKGFARFLKENASITVAIQGHTDDVGAQEVNQRLGLERAEAVKMYLYEKHQIPLHKMNVLSYGEDKPVSPNKTKAGRAQNRRVVIKVLA